MELAAANRETTQYISMLKVDEHVSLAQYTTFRIGGKARYFIRVTDAKGFPQVISYIQKSNIPYFILGGGSNILVDDKDFNGVVIKIETKGVSFTEDSGDVIVTAESGEIWDEVVQKTVERGLSGIEHLSWIPGTVGGAPVQNIGAYGKEFKDVCESIDAVNIETNNLHTFSKSENNFQYRNSFWKTKEGRKFIIVRVRMRLSPRKTSTADYKDLKSYFEKEGGDITPASVREAVIHIRKNKLPDVSLLGTAGSFFKNPVITIETYEALLKRYPLLPKFEAPNGMVKVPAAWILDHICNVKGIKEGDVGLYEKQPLAIVNFGSASFSDVKNFAEKISKKVFDMTGIIFEWEVEKVEL